MSNRETFARTMQAESLAISKVFNAGGDIHYVLPHFQREYSWDKPNWKTLLNDALGVYEEMAGKENEIGAVRVEHFLGSIVVIPDGLISGTIPILKIVDGQQRLTSLSLLLRAFAINLGGAHPLTKKIQKHLVNEDEGGDVFFKLLPTVKYGDRETYCAIIKGEVDAETHGVSRSRIPEAFEFFKGALGESLKKGLVPERFVQVLLTAFRVVFITLDQKESPHRIFESLNAKGKPLTPADLIRNYVAMRLPASHQERVFRESWSAVETRLQESQMVGRLPELTAFVRHYLAMRSGVLSEEGHVYARFRDRAEHQFDEAAAFEQELRTIARFSAYYDALRRPQNIKEPELRNSIERLNALDGISSYPFLLRLLEAKFSRELSLAQVCDACGSIENYLIRRHLAGEPTSYLNRMFPALWSELSPTDFAQSLRIALAAKRYPSNRKLYEAAESTELYANNERPRRRTTFLLENINRYLSQGTGGYTVLDSAATIEHILPQNPNDEWRAELGVQWQQISKDYLHTLGNLTLVTGQWNSSLSNSAFARKRALLSENALCLNKTWFSRDLPVWGRPQIQDRAKELCKLAIKIWPPLVPEEDIPDDSEHAEFTEESAERVALKLEKPLRRLSTSRFTSNDGATRLVGISSKTYESTGENDATFWFGFLMTQQRFLEGCSDGWLAFECGSAEKLLVVSYATFQPLLQSLNQTENRHWHVFLAERKGRFFLIVSREGEKRDVSDWRLLAS